MPRLAGLILLLVFSAALGAQNRDAEVKELIANLGSTDWETRELSQRKLVGIGKPARKQLRKALDDTDPELRTRVSAALVEIGETFAYAVECAEAESKGRRAHGRAALANLFRIDDPRNLRQLTDQEMQDRRWWAGTRIPLMHPPAITIARLESLSGFPVLVADAAAEKWAKILQLPTLRINIEGDIEQIGHVVQGVGNGLRTALGNVPKEQQLVTHGARIGRKSFIFVTTWEGRFNTRHRCGQKLLNDLLRGGAPMVRAASLLAEGAASDPAAAARLRSEFVENPESELLLWLALALGEDEKVQACVRRHDAFKIAELFGSSDWIAIEAAARALKCFDAEKRAEVLDPRIIESKAALELTVAIWNARGCKLSTAARARVLKLVGNKADALAAAAARWFAGADHLSDEELDAIWKAAETQPPTSTFFHAALELVGRKEVADKLVERARAALSGRASTQQALAAAVLARHVTQQDLQVALEKLGSARGQPALEKALTALFKDCGALTEKGRKKFIERLTFTDKAQRRLYHRALRACGEKLRLSLAVAADEELKADEKKIGDGVPPAHLVLARLELAGIRAGAGDDKALDYILEAARSEDVNRAKAAGAALVDAMAEPTLSKTLNSIKNNADIQFNQQVATEGYIELCRRAAELGDRDAFRKAQGRALGVQPNNWQIRRQVQQLQQQLEAASSDVGLEGLLPKGPKLDSLKVE